MRELVDRSRAPVGTASLAAGASVLSVLLDLRSRTVEISAIPAWRSFLALAAAWAIGAVAWAVPRRLHGTPGSRRVEIGAIAALTVAFGLRALAGPTAAPSRITIPMSLVAAIAAVLAASSSLRRAGARAAVPAVVEAWTGTFAVALALRGLADEPSVRLVIRTEDLQILAVGLLVGIVGVAAVGVGRRSFDEVASAVVGGVVTVAVAAAWWDEAAPRWAWAGVALVLVALRLGALGALRRGAHGMLRAGARGATRAGGTARSGAGALARSVSGLARRSTAAAGRGARRAGSAAAGLLAPLGVEEPRDARPFRFERGDRPWAWALGGLAVATVAADVIWAYRVGYQPIGHGVSITTQSWDVATGRHPLLGMPTSFADYQNGVETYHPGPLLFDMFAPFIRTLGLRNGAIIGSAACNLACWILGAWAGFRAGGRAAGIAAWLAGAVVVNVLLRDAPFESASAIMLFLTVLTVPLLCWAAATGTRKALPIACVVTTLTTQGYLAHGLVTVLPLTWATIVVAIEAVRGPGRRAARRSLAWTAGLFLVMWSLPFYEAITNGGGNIRALWLATRAGTPTIGAKGFVLAITWTLQLPLPWHRLERSFAPSYRAYLDGTSWVGPAILAGVVALMVVRRRHASANLRRLWVVGAVVLLSAGLGLSQFPVGFTAFYQLAWLASVAAFLWIVAVATIWALALRPWLADREAPIAGLRTATLAISSVVVLAAGLHTPARLETLKGRFAYIDRSVATMVRGADSAARGPEPTLVLSMDGADQQTMSDVVTGHLATLGHEVYVEPGIGGFFGAHRIVPEGWGGQALIVVDGSTPTRPPGRLVARSEPKGWSQARFDRVAARVAAWARAHGPIRPTPIVRNDLVSYLDPWMPGATCDELRRLADGRTSLATIPDGALARLLADDGLLSPQLPSGLRAELDEAAKTPFELWEVQFPAGMPTQTSFMRRDLTPCRP